MGAAGKTLLVLALAAGTEHGNGQSQSLYYVEPGVASCPAAPASNNAAPKAVPRGVLVPGGIHVTCGLDQGSYTVTLNSTDPRATFTPKTFLVNFGRVAGSGVFTVAFSTVGVQGVSATITSNMGSPAAPGHFASPANGFEVVVP